MNEEHLAAIVTAVQPYTMVPKPAIRFAAEQANAAVARDAGGVIVECGTWRGGSSMAMLLAQRAAFGRVICPVYLLDSFAGLPEATERDGPLARAWQSNQQGDTYDNCTASRADVETNLIAMGFARGEYEIVPGWFAETAPALARDLGSDSIALLRLDGDWYDSTLCCLQSLEPLVKIEAMVIVDDYYWWDGCARATHDYLSHGDFPYRLRSVPDFHGAYFYKRLERQQWGDAY